MEDISKIPRIPGDGAQDEPIEDIEKEAQLESRPNSIILRNNIQNSEQSEQENNESKYDMCISTGVVFMALYTICSEWL